MFFFCLNHNVIRILTCTKIRHFDNVQHTGNIQLTLCRKEKCNKNVTKFKYFGMAVNEQNHIHEENRINSQNVSGHNL